MQSKRKADKMIPDMKCQGEASASRMYKTGESGNIMRGASSRA